jgi:hypothetical protein
VLSKVPLLRWYRHAEHIKNITDESWELISGEVEKLVKSQAQDFCYPDAHDCLAWLVKQGSDVRILTYGDGEYQRFKLMTFSYLRSNPLPIHVTRRPKRDFIKRHFGQFRGVLIDDKFPLDLPKGWQHLWLDRQAKLNKPEQIKNDVIKIKSLNQAKLVLK